MLEGLDPVRKRPGMYIGSTSSKGLHHLVWEIVDNSIDEHMAGACDKILITIHEDNSVTVVDNGRGIPVGINEKLQMPALEVVLTVLHAGGKFNAKNSGYKTSGGLHGVGSSVVNALSSRMIATVKREGKIHQIEFEQGKTIRKMEIIGDCPEDETGTTIWFQPDPEIFKETIEYDFKTIHNHIRESAMLNDGLSITLVDEREIDDETEKPIEVTFKYDNGMQGYISSVNKNKTVLHEDIIEVSGKEDDIEVRVAFQYTDEYKDYIYSYTNNIRTPEGGVHETGFKSAIAQALKEYIESKGLIKDGEPLAAEDTRVGLTAVVTVRVPEPEFEGQTKSKLGNPGVRPVVHKTVYEIFSRYLDENPNSAQILADKVVKSYDERLTLKKARQALREKNKQANSSFGLPEKLADCKRSTPVSERELFLVEGDSAGGSAKQGRINAFQAILPLKGKVINTEKAALDKILKNDEIKGISVTVGTGVGDEFELEKRRYEKIIIMTDADVDGAHIRVLLLTFFYRFMRELIENGHIYIAQPPLYGLKKTANGKVFKYVQNDRELEESKKQYPNAEVQRYKGLGEMNPKDLKETTMDPLQRKLVRVTIEDAAEIDRMFDELMGKNPETRRDFIQKNGHKAELDI